MRSTSAKPKNVRENPHPQPIAKNNKPAIMMLSPARGFVTPGSETPFSSLEWTEPHTYLEWCRAASTSWIDSAFVGVPPHPQGQHALAFSNAIVGATQHMLV